MSSTPLSRAKTLRELHVMHHAEISDTGLRSLKKLENLQVLGLRGTKVTAEGVADLQKALPTCRIDWDGGLIAP